MLPDDFIEYSKRLEVGFLGFLEDVGPDIKLVHFEVAENEIIVRGSGLKAGKACLAFANEEYVWASENASINGRLEKKAEDEYLLVPDRAVWTIGFDIKKWPWRIVKRWKR